MKTKLITLLIIIIITRAAGYGQTLVTERITVLNPNHNYVLTNNLYNAAIPSPMYYDPANVNTNGAAFEIIYHNSDGGSSYDGYPSGTVGAYKKGGTYHPGIFASCGMPAQIQNIGYDFRIKWETYQQNVDGPNDKWWASINVIFDAGPPNEEPVTADRDYDLVIQFESYEQDNFKDRPKKTGEGQGGQYYYFCRDGFIDDGNGNNIAPLHTYDVVLEGTIYHFAVRYKFFNYPPGSSQDQLDKNNKVHIKFIPTDNADVMPFLDHPLKSFIDVTKTYYHLYIANLPEEEKALADQKVGTDSLWIKAVAAGYEVYKDAGDNNGGDSVNGITLGQHFFLTTTDTLAPTVVTDLNISGSPASPVLKWDPSTDAESVNSTIAEYKVYRSENEGAFTLLADKIYQESFTDTSVQTGSVYSYYVTATDRSFNETAQSNIVSTSGLGVHNIVLEPFRVYPNPVSDVLHIDGNISEIKTIELYSVSGRKQTISFNKNAHSINFQYLKKGAYFLKINKQVIKILHF